MRFVVLFEYLIWAWPIWIVYFGHGTIMVYIKLCLNYGVLNLGLVEFILIYHVLDLINWAYILVINFENFRLGPMTCEIFLLGYIY